MTIATKLPIHLLFIATLFFLSGCATMNLTYEEPSVEIVSFKALPVTGFEQKFEIGLKLVNPNNFALPLNGISYQLNVAEETLAHGVANNIPTAQAYGESRFTVPVSTSLIKGIQVISALMRNKEQGINYQLKAKLDIDIPLMPALTVIQNGTIPLSQP